MLALVGVLRQNCDDWSNFKAFVQGVIMRHGQIKKKFGLLAPVPRSATYINSKDPAGTTKAYPSKSELKQEIRAIQDRKRPSGTGGNGGASSSVKTRQGTLNAKKPRAAAEESKQAVGIQPQEMTQEERKRPLNRNRRQKPQMDCRTRAPALTASFIRNQSVLPQKQTLKQSVGGLKKQSSLSMPM